MDHSETPPLRRLLFGSLAAFILLAPAMPQLLGVHSPIFRPWVMYSGVGFGLLQGEFVVTRETGVEVMTPPSFFNLTRYPNAMRLTEPYLVFDEAGLARQVSQFCAANESALSVAFTGRIAMPQGWVALEANNACPQ